MVRVTKAKLAARSGFAISGVSALLLLALVVLPASASDTGGSTSGQAGALHDARGNSYACASRAGFNDACPEMVSVPYGNGRVTNGLVGGAFSTSEVLPSRVVPSPDGESIYAIAMQVGPFLESPLESAGTGQGFNTVAVVAYRADSGAPRWTSTLEPQDGHTNISTTGAAVSRDGTRLYLEGSMFNRLEQTSPAIAVSPTAFAAALDTETGDVLWQRDLRSDLKASHADDSNRGLAAGGIMVSPDDARIYLALSVVSSRGDDSESARAWHLALDAASGEPEWAKKYAGATADGGATTFSSTNSLALSPDGSRLLTLATLRDFDSDQVGFAVIAYDTGNGERLWLQEYPWPDWGQLSISERDTDDGLDGFQNPARGLVQSPDGKRAFVAYGPRHFEGCPDACVYQGESFAINAYDAATGAELWTRDYGDSVWAAAAGCESEDFDVWVSGGDMLATSPSGDLVHMLGSVKTKAKGCASGPLQTGVLTLSAASGEPAWVAAYDGGGTAGSANAPCGSHDCWTLLVAPGPSGGDAGSTVYVSATFSPDDRPPARGCNCFGYPLTVGLDGRSGRLVRQLRWIDTYYDIDGPDDNPEVLSPQGYAAVTVAGSRLYTIHKLSSENRGWYEALQVLGYDIWPAVAPTNDLLPVIGGIPSVGKVLTCPPGSWSGQPAPTYAYQWLRDGAAIPGATSDAYPLVDADAATAIACRVTASNSEGNATVTSAPVNVPAVPPSVGSAVVEGSAEVGAVLTCVPNGFGGAPAPSYSYQWGRDGETIAGASSATYTVAGEDAGHTLTCIVTATNPGGSADAVSAARAIAAPPSDAPIPTKPDADAPRPTGSAPAVGLRPPGEDGPTAQGAPPAPLKIKARPLRGRRVRKPRTLRLRVVSSEPLTHLTASLTRAKRKYGRGRLAQLARSRTLTVRLTRPLRRGAYRLRLTARRAGGTTAMVVVIVRVR